MSVGILLITHNRIGFELLETARQILGFCPVQTRLLDVSQDDDPDRLCEQAADLIRLLDGGDGVLVLTDCYGSTPSNIAAQLARNHRITVIAGVNLPMLLRIFNYPGLKLWELAEKARAGGKNGIMLMDTYRQARER